MSAEIESPSDLEVPQTYCILDKHYDDVLDRVKILSVGDTVAYGVRHDDGSRVKLPSTI